MGVLCFKSTVSLFIIWAWSRGRRLDRITLLIPYVISFCYLFSSLTFHLILVIILKAFLTVAEHSLGILAQINVFAGCIIWYKICTKIMQELLHCKDRIGDPLIRWNFHNFCGSITRTNLHEPTSDVNFGFSFHFFFFCWWLALQIRIYIVYTHRHFPPKCLIFVVCREKEF